MLWVLMNVLISNYLTAGVKGLCSCKFKIKHFRSLVFCLIRSYKCVAGWNVMICVKLVNPVLVISWNSEEKTANNEIMGDFTRSSCTWERKSLFSEA